MAGGMMAAGLAITPLAKAQTSVAPTQTGGRKMRRFLLNTGTLLGYNLSIEEEIAVTAQAGYDGIEIWLMRLEKYLDEGKSLADLKKRIDDSGLTVENAIGFASWIVDDEVARSRGLEQMKRDMGRLAQIGCTRIAAPASGATGKRIDDLEACGKRYRAILELGEREGVTPLLELWGGSATLQKLPDVVAIAMLAVHPKASLLLDAYHLYKGGNDYVSLGQLNGRAMPVFHLNDYPAEPPRETIADKDRVFPGDGICPFDVLLPTLDAIGFDGVLSLELFNQDYVRNYTPLELAKTGLEKMRGLFA
jgi:2-keto-myo-inositol isomerase